MAVGLLVNKISLADRGKNRGVGQVDAFQAQWVLFLPIKQEF